MKLQRPDGSRTLPDTFHPATPLDSRIADFPRKLGEFTVSHGKERHAEGLNCQLVFRATLLQPFWHHANVREVLQEVTDLLTAPAQCHGPLRDFRHAVFQVAKPGITNDAENVAGKQAPSVHDTGRTDLLGHLHTQVAKICIPETEQEFGCAQT